MGDPESKVNGHGTEPQAIIPAAPAPIITSGQTVDQMLAAADRQIAFRKGIVKLIAVNLDPSDVALYGEGDKQTIHLTKHACKQILSWAGITVQPDSGILEKHYDGVEGPYIDFEVWATWIRGTQAYRAMGNRSTYDDFYAKCTKYACEFCGADIEWRKVANQDKNAPFCKAGCQGENRTRWAKTDYYLPLSEVDIPSIKQAAITNLWNHVVEDAGLKPSKKELEAVGFRFEDAGANVKFNSGKPSEVPAQSPVAKPTGAAAKPQDKPAAAPSSQAPKSTVPKAQIPKDQFPGDQPAPAQAPKKAKPQGEQVVVNGVIQTSYLNQGTKGRYVKLTLKGGAILYCFHDSTVATTGGDMNLLDMISGRGAQGMAVSFIVKRAEKGDTIEGARRIGNFEWDEGGIPTVRREPGEEPF